MTEFRRRADDRYEVELEVVDDVSPNKLTLTEIKELKRLANMSRTARVIAAVVLGVITLFGFPSIIAFFKAHWL